MKVVVKVLGVTVVLVILTVAAWADITGKPDIIDGDTIKIAGQRIRLHGIDAPESKQSCTVNGEEWRCGQEATWALARIIENHWVMCREKDIDRYKRIIAICYLDDGTDLNALMVSQGWALAYRRYSMDYVDEEEAARDARVGIWRGEFVEPWEWRMK